MSTSSQTQPSVPPAAATLVEFDRIGSRRPAPLRLAVSLSLDDLLRELRKYGRKFLASPVFEVEIAVDEATGYGNGRFVAGFRPAGTFRIIREDLTAVYEAYAADHDPDPQAWTDQERVEYAALAGHAAGSAVAR